MRQLHSINIGHHGKSSNNHSDFIIHDNYNNFEIYME